VVPHYRTKARHGAVPQELFLDSGPGIFGVTPRYVLFAALNPGFPSVGGFATTWQRESLLPVASCSI
jgi:hypothetical protein